MTRGYICKDDLYNKIVELEDLALQRVNDTPSTMFDNINPAYIRYCAQLNERTNLKHLIIDAPTEDVRPVVRGKWERGYSFPDGEYVKCIVCGEIIKCIYPMHYCPNCGAEMAESEEE